MQPGIIAIIMKYCLFLCNFRLVVQPTEEHEPLLLEDVTVEEFEDSPVNSHDLQ